MYNETQLVKGILEGCILKIVAKEQIYGYKTVEKLITTGFDVNEATVYPILARLQKKGLLDVEKRPSPYGPDRKYYYLTVSGGESLRSFEESWQKIKRIVDQVMEGEEHDREK